MRGFVAAAYAALLLSASLPAYADAPPIAVVAPVPVIECTANGKGVVQLDASASYDPEGAPLTFAWSAPSSVAFSAPASAVTTATASMGHRTATLLVSDGSATTTRAVSLDIRDTVPPTSTLRVDGARLANGWIYRDAQVRSIGNDACDSAPCGLLRLRGSTDIDTACDGIGLYGPGTWTAEHWARDASGNAGAHANSSPIVVVYNFRSTISTPTREPLEVSILVNANFDGVRPVPNAIVRGTIHRETGYPGSIDGILRFPFEGTTDANGNFRYDAPLVATLPGEYRLRVTTEALGFSRIDELYYGVGLV